MASTTDFDLEPGHTLPNGLDATNAATDSVPNANAPAPIAPVSEHVAPAPTPPICATPPPSAVAQNHGKHSWCGVTARGSKVSNVLTILSLGIALWIGIVTVRIMRWTASNDALQSCYSAEAMAYHSKFCNETIARGVIPPPVRKRSAESLAHQILASLSLTSELVQILMSVGVGWLVRVWMRLRAESIRSLDLARIRSRSGEQTSRQVAGVRTATTNRRRNVNCSTRQSNESIKAAWRRIRMHNEEQQQQSAEVADSCYQYIDPRLLVKGPEIQTGSDVSTDEPIETLIDDRCSQQASTVDFEAENEDGSFWSVTINWQPASEANPDQKISRPQYVAKASEQSLDAPPIVVPAVTGTETADTVEADVPYKLFDDGQSVLDEAVAWATGLDTTSRAETVHRRRLGPESNASPRDGGAKASLRGKSGSGSKPPPPISSWPRDPRWFD